MSISTSSILILSTCFCDRYEVRADMPGTQAKPRAITFPPGRDISAAAELHHSKCTHYVSDTHAGWKPCFHRDPLPDQATRKCQSAPDSLMTTSLTTVTPLRLS